MSSALSEKILTKKKSDRRLRLFDSLEQTSSYIPVYVISGFLDSGKTTLLNELLTTNTNLCKTVCCIQFEEGEEALGFNESSQNESCDSFMFSIREVQKEGGIPAMSQKLYDYLSENQPDEIWIEWNGVLPLSVLERILYGEGKQEVGTPGEYCRIHKNLFVADGETIRSLLSESSGNTADLLANSDLIVVRNAETANRFRSLKRSFSDYNAGVSVYARENLRGIQKSLFGSQKDPFVTLQLGILCFFLSYFVLMQVCGKATVETIGSIFLGIILQALPFLMIGILLSSAIQVFVPRNFIEKHFPKNIYLGILFAALSGFFLPVCDCASVPVFRSLIKKGVPLTSAVTFMMATPVINPVVILSTAYAFGGNYRVVLCRIVLGLLCSTIIGFTFIGTDANKILKSKFFSAGSCSSGCGGGIGDRSSGKLTAFLRHAQTEFFTVGKYLMIGALISSVIQLFTKNISWSKNSGGLFIPLLIMIAMAFLLSLCSSSDAVVAKSFSTRFPMGALMGFLVFGPMMDVKNLIMLSGSFTKKFIVRLVVTTFIVCITMVYFAFSLGLGDIL